MESYLVEVIDEDHESSVVMNFAESIEELIDNIVCMEQFVFVTKIKRISNNKEIKLTKGFIDLEDLRMYRLLIDDEVALRQTLTNNENNNTVQ